MSYLEELLPEFRKGAKIRRKCDDNFYWVMRDGDIYNSRNQISNFDAFALSVDDWEIVKEQEPDWNYIIENKCLCWFWGKADDKFNNIGFLAVYNGQVFLSSDSFAYSHCCPVRRDEVSFYEDREE